MANDGTSLVEQGLVSPNTSVLNGVSANLVSPNGNSNTTRLTSVRMGGVTANGAAVNASTTGAPLSGAALVGSRWTGNLSDGSTIALRIDEAVQGSGANGDLWSYKVSGSTDNATWRSLCTDASGAAAYADTVTGSWNLAEGVPGGGAYRYATTEFTFACRGSAIAKCVELGYRPWSGYQPELASCVRALRGDYCGDGTSYTLDGTTVNIYDNRGIAGDSNAWAGEAEWTPDGATCVSKKKESRFWQTLRDKPSCYPHSLKAKKSCGEQFSSGVAIITELPEQ